MLTFAGIALLGAFDGLLAAPTASDRFQVSELQRYFAGEKAESLWFMLIGLPALLMGIHLTSFRGGLQRGLGIPLAAIGLIQVIVGASVYFRTDAQVAELLALLNKEPALLAAQEIPRMKTVIFWFDVYKTIEIFLLWLGLMLFIGSYGTYRRVRTGLGVGLILQSTLMLGLDFAAEARADRYYAQITRLITPRSARPARPRLHPPASKRKGGQTRP